MPTSEEEQDALWDATQNLDIENGESDDQKSTSPLPHPKHYADWFDFFDDINFSLRLALAAASFISPNDETKDFVKGKSIFIPLIAKLSTALCV